MNLSLVLLILFIASLMCSLYTARAAFGFSSPSNEHRTHRMLDKRVGTNWNCGRDRFYTRPTILFEQPNANTRQTCTSVPSVDPYGRQGQVLNMFPYTLSSEGIYDSFTSGVPQGCSEPKERDLKFYRCGNSSRCGDDYCACMNRHVKSADDLPHFDTFHQQCCKPRI